jgi:hypothetical protein
MESCHTAKSGDFGREIDTAAFCVKIEKGHSEARDQPFARK